MSNSGEEPMIQFLLHHCCIISNKLFILSVWWLPLLHLLNCYWTFKTHERLLPSWGFFQKPRLKMNCFFSTLSPFPWPPATCLSLCLRWWPCCWTTGQFSVLLGSSSSPFLVPLTALLLVHHSLWQLCVCTSPTLSDHSDPKGVFLCLWPGLPLMVSSGPWWWSVSFSQIFLIILLILPMWCWFNYTLL